MTDIRKDFLNAARPLAMDLIDHAAKAGKPYGITDARVIINSRDEMETELEDGKISKSISGATNDVTVALYAGNRTLSFRRNTLDPGVLREAMTDNMKVIHLVPETPNKALLDGSAVFKGAPADLDLIDKTPPTAADMITFARQVEEAAAAHPGIYKVDGTSITRGIGHTLSMATNGLDHCDSGTYYQAVTSVVVRDAQGLMENDYAVATARHFSDLGSPQELGRMAAKKAVARLGATLPATGDAPVVLSPEAAASFFGSVFASISGTAIYRGTSFMKDKIGQQVMDPGITIIDQPQIRRGLGSAQIDNAGQEMKDITFVENGVLKSYNLSLVEARRLGLPPIGRDGVGSVTNASVLPGQQTPEAMIKSVGDGIYVDGFHGGQVNVNTGVFSRQAHGRLIRDGEITDQAVAGFVVSGNLKDMFMNVAVANDTPPQPNTRGQLAAPTTLLKKAMIAGQ